MSTLGSVQSSAPVGMESSASGCGWSGAWRTVEISESISVNLIFKCCQRQHSDGISRCLTAMVLTILTISPSAR